MSLPTTFEALLIIALIFVPGIIFGQLIRRSIAHFPETVDARHFLAMGASGLFLHALVFPIWTRFIVDWYRNQSLDDHWLSTYLWFLIIIFLWPVVAGVVTALIIPKTWVDKKLDKVGLGYVDRIPSAWDFAVLPQLGTWVKIYLQDGSIVAGVFGKDSFASLYSRNRDLFLQEIYDLGDNNDFAEPVVDSVGVWIAQESISHIEFYRAGGRANNSVQQGDA